MKRDDRQGGGKGMENASDLVLKLIQRHRNTQTKRGDRFGGKWRRRLILLAVPKLALDQFHHDDLANSVPSSYVRCPVLNRKSSHFWLRSNEAPTLQWHSRRHAPSYRYLGT